MKQRFRCSFCGKIQDNDERLIVGPGVYICEMCILRCMEILQKGKESDGILSEYEIQELLSEIQLSETEMLKQLLKESGAFIEGHFVLSSGLHSGKYIQCAKTLQFPELTWTLSAAIVSKFKHFNITVVIGPALGAVTLAYEVSRRLNAQALFTEREQGKMVLRRGFEIKEGENVLVVEDVLTTGGSVKEVMEVVHAHGGNVVGVGALVDRSDGKLDLGVPVHALLKISVEKYPPEDCPLCKQGIPLVKPGSRKAY